ncbi:MAG: ATP-grasp domain-containing protein [Bacteroidales bacterium]|nr:ATP-grasp domain-containing protein [Saprospiraceae bacterium]MCF8381571.1 ATP-grasp domain-containing protein [Bacteroidales bacterium]
MRRLAIIGASYLQLPLVRKAKEMGIETHCFAWEDGAVCKDEADFYYPISIIEKEQILEVCKAIQIDGITSIASDVAVPTVCFVAEKLGLTTNSYKESLITTDKYLMRLRFTEYNVLSPRYVIANENYSLEGLNFPLIIKPTDRSGSRGVIKVKSESEVMAAVDRAKKESFKRNAIIEEYVMGSEVSVETISWQGKHFILAITDKVTTGEPYFVEIEHHQPSQLSENIQRKINTITLNALDALNIKFGASHSEFIITEKEEVYAVEVGARMGGDFIGSSLVQLSTGFDFVKGVIENALGIFTEPVYTEQSCSGVFFICEETKHLLQIVQNSNFNKDIIEAELPDKELNKIQCSADRNGYFIYHTEKRIVI